MFEQIEKRGWNAKARKQKKNYSDDLLHGFKVFISTHYVCKERETKKITKVEGVLVKQLKGLHGPLHLTIRKNTSITSQKRQNYSVICLFLNIST